MEDHSKHFILCKKADHQTCPVCHKNTLSRSFYFHICGTIVKGIVGVMSGSQALIADAVHSLTDTFAFGVNYIGGQIRPKSEYTQSLVIGSIIFLCGVWILADNLKVLLAGTPAHPGLLGLLVAGLSVVMNVYLFRISRCSLSHDPENRNMFVCMVQNRTNLYAASTAFTGILLADLGLVYCDPIFAISIGFIQFHGAIDIFKQGFALEDRLVRPARHHAMILLALLSCCILGYFVYDIHEILVRRTTVMIPARAPATNESVSDLLGRSRYFYIVDTDKHKTTLVMNPARNNTQDASDPLLATVEKYRVGVVLAQRIGPEMFNDLKGAGVKMYYLDTPVTVSHAMSLYQDQQLQAAMASNVDRGYGRKRVRWMSPW